MPDLTVFNLAVSWALFGLTWMVQLVTYPAFRYVSKNRFGTYHFKHMRHITFIVMPLMLLELFLAVYFVLTRFSDWQYWGLFLLVMIIWIVTATVAMPLHKELSSGKDRTLIDRLIRAQWVRTFLWTTKAIWVLFLI